MAEKKQLNARAVLVDINVGMTDAQLMMKYGLSEKGLESLKKKLIAAGLLPADRLNPVSPSGSVSVDRNGKLEETVDLDPSTVQLEKPSTMPINSGSTEKRSVSAKQVLADINAQMSNADIMSKYGISKEGFEKILVKLSQNGLIPKAECDKRTEALRRAANETPPAAGKVIQVDLGAGFQTAKNLFNRAKKATDQVVGSVEAKLDKLEEDAEELPEEVKQRFFGLTVVSACMILITAALFAWMVAWLLTSSWGWFLVCWLVLGAIVTATGIAVLKATKLNYKYLTIPAAVLLGLNITFPFIGAGGSPDCCDIAMKFCDEIDKAAGAIKNEGDLIQAMNNLMVKVETKVKPAIETSCGDCSESIFKEMMEYLGYKIDVYKNPMRDIQAAPIRAKIKGECTECKRGKKRR